MIRNLRRLNWLNTACLFMVMAWLPQAARALDTANVLMNIDGMVINHQGLFRNFSPGDGPQTFSYGTFQTGAGTQGRYKSFFLVIPGGATDNDSCCISHRIRQESWGPETFLEAGDPDVYGTVPGIDITKDYYPVIDRAGFGSVIDPTEYQLEVKFKPVIGMAGLPSNVAKEVNASIDRHYGFVFNAEKGIYERSIEQISYSIGINSDADYNNDGVVNTLDRDIVLSHKGEAFQLQNENPEAQTPGVVDYEDLQFWEQRNGRVVTPINTWYTSAPKDANGFATWSVPLTNSVSSYRSTNINYGDTDFRDSDTVSGGGRFQNPDNFTTPNAWQDDPVAWEQTALFGGGPEDPSRPGSKLNTPNGINLLYFGKNGRRQDPVSLEVLSVAIKKINPGQIAARIDEYSGISGRFGSGFTRGPGPDAAPFAPINIPGDSVDYLPRATDQISRFDENGLTNLVFNMRTPDDPANETHRFFLRYGPGANTFDGTNAVVNVRAKLTAGNTATVLTLVAKDLDGNDLQPNQGADEYTYNLNLNQFNSSTFTTVSIPLSQFTLSTHVPRDDNAGLFGSGPGGFVNAGDGSIAEFNLYEFGGLLAPNTGLLKLEMDYMEIRLPSTLLVGDYNSDGKVDARDYTVWRDHLGADGSVLGANRDPANSGVVSAADYNSWKSHYGQMAGSGALANSGAVPEPATFSLFAWLLGLAAARRRTRSMPAN
ncbi:MAG: hypothetical protein AB7G28_08790 [Pirellulales bacterium]